MKANEIKAKISKGELDKTLTGLYGESQLQEQRVRWTKAIDSFTALYGDGRDLFVLSVPGRSEISGNHTDHNLGKIIAASINLDIIAVAALTGNDTVTVKSEGFSSTDVVRINDIDKSKVEKFRSSAIIAGVCDGFKQRGYKVCGFDAYTTSSVLKGSGLSSSAAFEVMIGALFSHLANDGEVSQQELAKIAQYAENEFFGKPCGLMDQMACALGGLISIDFGSEDVEIKKLSFDMSAAGYSLCIVNTGGSHSDLNDEYAAIPAEMKKVAEYFGKKVLRGIEYDDIIKNAKELRSYAGDRAILRAIHFCQENERVEKQIAALEADDLKGFLALMKESGNSSFRWLQNVFATKDPFHQGITLALAVAEKALAPLADGAACRIHGGGFAGTMVALMPNDFVESYRAVLDQVFGEGSCKTLLIRAAGADRFI